MSKTITSKVPSVRLIIFIASILLLAALYSWFRLVYSRPAVVFDRMLNSMLATPGVSKQISQTEGTQKVNQNVQLTTMPQQRVHSASVLHQGEDGSTVITTESIGTIPADYVRYTDIKTSQKTTEGKAFNFSSVLGIWGRAAANDPNSGGAQLFNQMVLGVIPVGNVSGLQRKQLINQIEQEQVYQVDYSSLKREVVAGRPQYTYDVTIRPVAYVNMLKTFAHDIGIKELESVDPAQYKDTPPLRFTMDIDVWSGQLKKITYKDSDRSETYGSYGARLQISPPQTTLTVQELQSRLQQIQ
ncbi:MAG TPA: hypothetical protein VM124_02710 [Candidatus Limnocylindrales bacterium]|nr:hypothetical protein [Candidatus Limnocylindrales bacterium]